MFLIDILALIGAIVLIVRIIQLRQIAALPFARVQARFIAASAPPAIADLHAQAESALQALGFAPARWVHMSSADTSIAPLRAVHVHPGEHAALWLLPPSILAPNRLASFFVTRLADGRVAITQPFDCFFELYVGSDSVAQSVGAPSFAEQWAAHRAMVANHGPADPAGVTPGALLAFNDDWMEQQRQRLIAQGDLVPVSADVARPSLRMAWRALGAIRRAPKPPADASPVPAARIALVATQFERTRERSPARSIELALFAVSVALFMALGALLWDVATAWMILVVIVIHELGHFLAMRAFGYRNVHMMALPLVGGVAIGQDVDPSAHRSAWMSLMGPLPGIVIGWAILIAMALDLWPAALGEPTSWALMFLLVNYLNVLPVPPLDGGHVVQALLPPRRAWLEVGFIAVACTLGAWLAWSYDLILLTIIALLQLLSLPARLHAHRALAQLADAPPAAGMLRPLRLRLVADALERALGPARTGKERVEQVLDVLHRLDRRPMRAWQTLLVGIVYAFLLVVPVGALLLGASLGGAGGDEYSSEALEARQQASELQQQRLRSEAAGKTDQALVSELVAAADWAPAPSPPATDAALAGAGERIGMPVPVALADLYRMHDGIEALSLAPLADLRRAGPAVDELFDLIEVDEIGYSLVADDSAAAPPKVHRNALRDWLLIGSFEGDLLLFNPNPGAQPVQILQLWLESPTGYRSVAEWLQQSWISARAASEQAELMASRQQQALQRFADADWPVLIDAIEPQIPLPYRWLADLPEVAGPATAEALAGTEQRLGRTLPADYRRLLELHNGHPALQIGPVERIRVLDTMELANSLWLKELPRTGDARYQPAGQPITLGASAELVGCWALDGDAKVNSGAMLLCPAGHQHAGVIDLRVLLRYPDLLSYGRARAAMASANSVESGTP